MPSWGKATGNRSDAYAKLLQGLAWAEEAAMEVAQIDDNTAWIQISQLCNTLRGKVQQARQHGPRGARGLIMPSQH